MSVQILTMGFTKKSAEDFFDSIRERHVEILIDVRLNNQSQLAGFTKGRDLAFFLKEICNCRYSHEIQFAPTKDILNRYKKEQISWEEYEVEYNELIKKRNVLDIFKKKYLDYDKVLLLCSEPTPECCHRRLLADFLSGELGNKVIHI